MLCLGMYMGWKYGIDYESEWKKKANVEKM